MNNRYVVVDVETTGNKIGTDRIIQIGALLIENGEMIERFSSFVNPHMQLSSFIKQFTGIDDEMLIKAPTFSEIAPMLLEMLEGSYFVAHNVPFDYSFLNIEIENSGYELLNCRTLDTVELSRILYPSLDGYKLNQLATEFAIQHDQPHRADSDAEVTARLLMNLLAKLQKLPLVTLRTMESFSSQFQSDVSKLLKETIQAKINSLEIEVGSFDVYRGFALQSKSIIADQNDHSNEYVALDLPSIGASIQKAKPDFEIRQGQFEMVETIETALSNHFHCMIEAGTGTGKTLGYLIPALLYAKKMDRRVVVSTYTTHLQEQIIDQEIKLLKEAFPFPFQATILKGRHHYLCLRKFEQMLEFSRTDNYDTTLTKIQILIWLTETEHGDIDELNLPSGGKLFWNKVKSDANSCHNYNCPWFSKCFYHQKRREAEKSTVIVTNHALLFADIKSDYSILPSYSELIIDEAHHLEDAASQYLGVQLDYFTIQTLLNQLGLTNGYEGVGKLLELAATIEIDIGEQLIDLDESFLEIKEMIDDLFRKIRSYVLKNKAYNKNEIGRLSYRYNLSTESGTMWKDIKNHAYIGIEKIEDYLLAIGQVIELIATNKEQMSPSQKGIVTDLTGIIQSLENMTKDLSRLLFEVHGNRAAWIETEPKGAQNATFLFSQPIDISELLRDQLFAKKQSVILTSATLAIKESFDYLKSSLGMDDFEVITKVIPSPFSYKDQVQLMIPTDIPEINEVEQGEFINDLANQIIQIAKITKGRMLILFTSFEMLEKTYVKVKDTLELDSYVLIGQGISSGSRARLTKNFKQYDRAILFGTSSFWEGIDIPGEDLSCIVIARLPFSPPDYPILAGRAELLKEQGKNPFMELYLPQAILRFKQGFGRLVRAKNDRGVIVVLDRRIMTKNYGKKFINALPKIDIYEAPTDEILAKISKWL